MNHLVFLVERSCSVYIQERTISDRLCRHDTYVIVSECRNDVVRVHGRYFYPSFRNQAFYKFWDLHHSKRKSSYAWRPSWIFNWATPFIQVVYPLAGYLTSHIPLIVRPRSFSISRAENANGTTAGPYGEPCWSPIVWWLTYQKQKGPESKTVA